MTVADSKSPDDAAADAPADAAARAQQREQARQFREERLRRRRLTYRKRYGDENRARRYGLSLEDFRALIARNACDICARSNRRLCIDHCEASGIVRGLLCENCNLGLGCFTDDPRLIEKAEAYLRAGREGS